MIKKIKAKLYSLFFWQSSLGEIFNKLYDLNIFLSNYFTTSSLKNKSAYQAFLTKQYHIVEKGLALPIPRKNFGIPKIKVLIEKAIFYRSKYGEDRIVRNIQEVLNQYLERNSELRKLNIEFYKMLVDFIDSKKFDRHGGVKIVTVTEIKKAVNIDFKSFMQTRSSVRNFSSENNILEEEVYKAIEIAKYTPSVCNRQSWRVHYFDNRVMIDKLLKIQNGNNGFTESINKLLIVTTSTKYFTKLESNQVFVDGGMFAMSLVLALHSQSIASCCLNTCLPYVDEKKIKIIGKIPKDERLIMMIGIGKYKEVFEVAISNRIPLEEIIRLKK